MLRKAVAVSTYLSFAAGAVGMALGLPAITPRALAQEPGQQSVGGGQQGGQGRGQFAGMQRIGGEVASVTGATLTVKAEDGATYQIVTTDNTRLMKGRGVPLKLADLKPGDGVMAMGNLDAPNKTLHAAVLFATNGSELREQRANLGKTFIAGKVTAIDLDNAKMTVERPDSVSQTIGLDESTSFRRGGRGGGMGTGGAVAPAAPAPGAESGESITLADIKVGDNVRGTGSMKNGIFVPSQLVVGAPGQGRGGRRGGAGGSAPSGSSPTGSVPAGPPQGAAGPGIQ
jgi:hypothetical protein